MFKTTGGFDKLLDKATSHLLMDPDWPSILQICDLVRQDDIQPKYVMTSIKKKLFSANPHTALYALLVLESLVKNCGSVFHDELTLRVNCEMLHDLVKTTTHENVRQKLLELVQAWTHAFRKNTKHSCMKEIMDSMKSEGCKFPALAESDAMFTADTAPEWADGEVCHRCRATFSVLNRKHHCRNCGQVFCSSCSQKAVPLPKFGIEKEVRVCDGCYDQVTKPIFRGRDRDRKVSPNSRPDDSDLPAEYLNSSLAQQSQVPQRKTTEDELREEEELQLALALSQSEAEAKEKQKVKGAATFQATTKVELRHADRTPTPPLEEPAATNPELARYLNRSYWENRQADISVTDNNRPTSPSAPSPAPTQTSDVKYQENGLINRELQEFINTLKSQVEIFINRMKSNCSRGRPVANDSSVQTLFLNITTMHSQLLHYIQEHDDSRLYYERLQDKLTQVRDARAALDALRDEHREKVRRQAEEAERIRQLQMAHKLDIMRKKKQEYLQYQRQLALQRVQEQEREMQMRQEQQKQQYLMGSGGFGNYQGQPVHDQYPPPTSVNVGYRAFPYGQPMLIQGGPMPSLPGTQNIQANHPHIQGPGGMPPGLGPQMPLSSMLQQQQHNSLGMMQVQPPSGLPQMPSAGLQQLPPGLPQQHQQIINPNLPPNMISHVNPMQGGGSLGHAQQVIPQQLGAPPASLQVQQTRQNSDTQTAELISFD